MRKIAEEIDGWRKRGECGVLTCSALKRSYRDIIIGDRREVALVYLKGSRDLIRGRILARVSSESAYAALGLGPGMNWWWIDRKGGKWRSIVYSEARNERSIKILDSLRPHPSYPWRQSIARFVFLDTVVAMWHYSGGGGDCEQQDESFHSNLKASIGSSSEAFHAG